MGVVSWGRGLAAEAGESAVAMGRQPGEARHGSAKAVAPEGRGQGGAGDLGDVGGSTIRFPGTSARTSLAVH